MALIYQSGYVFKDDGTAVSGATIQLYQTDTTTLVTLSDASTSTTTNSSGYYSASVTEVGATSSYDVKITSGSSVRYRRGNDKLQLEELDIRNDTGATQGGLLVANTTNSTANKVATFAGRNTTGATADEIYISYELHNASEAVKEFARMTVVARDATASSEDGEIQFDVMKAGTLTKVWTISSSASGATSFDIETSTVTMAVDDFTIKSEDDGSAAILYMFADQGDEAADKWRIQIADGGVMTYASYISGSYVAHMTVTPHATVASSTVAFAGGVTIAADLTITGDDLTMGTNTSGHVLVADGTNYNPVAVSGDVTMASNGAVTIASTAVETAMIAGDAITGAKIADDAIGSEHIADDAVVSAAIADDAIITALIADDAITSALIADDAITTALIADDAITSALIADDAITSALIADDAIITALIADDAVDSDQIAAGAIDNAHLADDAVDSDELAAGSVDAAHIAADAVTAAKIGDDVIDSEHYTDASVDFAHIQNVAANSILGRDANSSGVLSEVALATTQILIGDGTGFTAAALSGDATMTNAGVVTVAAATTSADGISELATSAEVSTGTATDKVIVPEALSDSVIFGTRYVQCVVFDFTTDIAEGDGKFYIHIPAGLNGMDLVEAHAKVITVGDGSTVNIQIHNLTDTTDMLSTALTIDDGELDSKDAGTGVVINASEDDVVTNDVLRIDVDGNGGDTTVAKGLIVTLGFRMPTP